MSQTVADLIVKVTTENKSAVAGIKELEDKMGKLPASGTTAGKKTGDGLNKGIVDGVKGAPAAIQGALSGGMSGLATQMTSHGANLGKNLVSGLTSSLSGLGNTIASMVSPQMAALAGVAALGAGIAVTTNKAIEFDKGMHEVFTLLPNLTSEAKDKMISDLKSFDNALGVTSDKSVPALYQALSSGVPKDNVFEFLEVAKKAASGGVTDLETAVDGLSTVVNSYGQDTITATQASDLMFTTVKDGKTKFADLAQYIFKVAPSAAAMGVSFDNVTAAMAAITLQGKPTRIAGTQLDAMLAELADSSSDVAKKFETLTGKSFKDFLKGGGNLQTALQVLEKDAKSSGKSIDQLFQSTTAGAAAISLTGAQTETFTRILDDMQNSAGATATAATEMGQSWQSSLNKLAAVVDTFLITVGEAFAPFIALLAQGLKGIMPLFQTIAEGLKLVFTGIYDIVTWYTDTVSKNFALLAEVFQPTIDVIKGLVADILPFVKNIIDSIMSVITAFTGFNDKINEMGIRLLGVLNGPLKLFVEMIGTNLKIVFATISGVIGVFCALLRGDLSGAFDAAGGMVRNFQNIFKDWSETLAETGRAIQEWISKDLPAILANLPKAIEDQKPAMNKAGYDLGKEIGSGFRTAWDELCNWISTDGKNNIVGNMQGVVDSVIGVWRGLYDAIAALFSGESLAVIFNKALVNLGISFDTEMKKINQNALQWGAEFAANLINGMINALTGGTWDYFFKNLGIGFLQGIVNPNTNTNTSSVSTANFGTAGLTGNYTYVGSGTTTTTGTPSVSTASAPVTVTNTDEVGAAVAEAPVDTTATDLKNKYLARGLSEESAIALVERALGTGTAATGAATVNADNVVVTGDTSKAGITSVSGSGTGSGKLLSEWISEIVNRYNELGTKQKESLSTQKEFDAYYSQMISGSADSAAILEGAWNKINGGISEATTSTRELKTELTDTTITATDGITKLNEEVLTDFKQWREGGKTALEPLYEGVTKLIPVLKLNKTQAIELVDFLKNNSGTAINTLLDSFELLADKIGLNKEQVQVLESYFTSLGDKGSATADKIDTKMTGAFNSIKTTAKASLDAIQSYIDGLTGKDVSINLVQTSSGLAIQSDLTNMLSGLSSVGSVSDTGKVTLNSLAQQAIEDAWESGDVSSAFSNIKNNLVLSKTTEDLISEAQEWWETHKAAQYSSASALTSSVESALTTQVQTAVTDANSCIFGGSGSVYSGNSNCIFGSSAASTSTASSSGSYSSGSSVSSSLSSLLSQISGSGSSATGNYNPSAILAARRAASQPTSYCSFAEGGTNIGGGLSLVGEEGPEIMAMPKNTSVLPLPFITNVLSKLGSSFTGIANKGTTKGGDTVSINNSGMFSGAKISVRDDSDIDKLATKISSKQGEMYYSARRRAGLS